MKLIELILIICLFISLFFLPFCLFYLIDGIGTYGIYSNQAIDKIGESWGISGIILWITVILIVKETLLTEHSKFDNNYRIGGMLCYIVLSFVYIVSSDLLLSVCVTIAFFATLSLIWNFDILKNRNNIIASTILIVISMYCLHIFLNVFVTCLLSCVFTWIITSNFYLREK